MAFLASTGAVAAVITEDSDLVAYGVARVFLKLDLKTGAGVEVASAALPRCRELNLSGFSADTFLHMCVLSGCDYAPGLPGVGPRKAAALLRRFRTVAAAVRHLRFEGTPVPRGYEAQLQDALWTFAHQFVFDAAAGACVHRTPLPDVGGPPPERVVALLGAAPSAEEAAGVAEGRLDPMTLLPFPVRVCHARAAPSGKRIAACVSAYRARADVCFRPLLAACAGGGVFARAGRVQGAAGAGGCRCRCCTGAAGAHRELLCACRRRRRRSCIGMGSCVARRRRRCAGRARAHGVGIGVGICIRIRVRSGGG